MIEIIHAENGEALEEVIRLAQEYVTWMMAEVGAHYPDLDTQEFASEHTYDDVRKKFPGEHVPPHGCLLIAKQDGAVCGCIALAKLTDRIGEVRTLFVRPTCRGGGVGKQLVEACLNEARKCGYQTVRLDTLRFMESAQKLYKSMGFYDIEPYLDLSDNLKRYICFMECQLPN
ncbi:MAG: GNAT family N-acetyltransferase [Chloroflexota bacterium]